MKKHLAKLLIALSIGVLSVGNAQAHGSVFSDVAENHEFYNAIQYLENNRIVGGFNDGTFRPDQAITRAELLKIALLTAKVPLQTQSTSPFNDTQNHWAADYIATAHSLGWIQGYEDGQFKPERNISRSEALKIVAKAYNWSLNDAGSASSFRDVKNTDWFHNYLNYAETNNLLFTKSYVFLPNQEIQRDELSELIYRSDIKKNNSGLGSEEIENQPEEETSLEVDESANVEFDKITLAASLPKTFYLNELFYIEGETTANTNQITVVLENISNRNQREHFRAEVKNKKFSIPVYFHESGNYYLGIINGSSGTSKAQLVEVKNNFPTGTNATIKSLDVTADQGQPYLEYTLSKPDNINFTFQQGNKTLSIYHRQNINKIALDPLFFSDFQEGSIRLSANTGEQTSKSTNFTAVKKHFSEISEQSLTINEIYQVDTKETIKLKATFHTEYSPNAYVILPDGFVEELSITNSQLTYTPEKSGAYIFEINNSESIPIYNHPIYVGNVVPLIPDYFSLHNREFLKLQNFDLQLQQSKMLAAINQAREDHGLGKVVLDQQLSNLAQAHSDDLANQKYFAHVNLAGETPEDRRKKMGIPTAVNENLAKDVSVAFAHEGLMRSAGHRDNILDPAWSKVGIGISIDDGYLVIAQEFSYDLPSQNTLDQYETQLLNAINADRTQQGLNALNRQGSLQSATDELNVSAIDSGGELNSNTLKAAMDKYGIQSGVYALGRVHNNWQKIMSSIIDSEGQISESALLEADSDEIGLSLLLDFDGLIHLLILAEN